MEEFVVAMQLRISLPGIAGSRGQLVQHGIEPDQWLEFCLVEYGAAPRWDDR